MFTKQETRNEKHETRNENTKHETRNEKQETRNEKQETRNPKPHPVPDYALVVGNPARHIGWMSEYGHRLHFVDDKAKCQESGEEYVLEEGEVRKVT